jgi:tetratricopeptide (TPR) repeat protein
LAAAVAKVAGAHRAAGRAAEAAGAATRARDLFAELAAGDPASAEAQRELALADGTWGEALDSAGRPTAALVALHRSLDRFVRAAAAGGAAWRAKMDAAAARERLAGVYAARGLPKRAFEEVRAAFEAWGEVAAARKQKSDSHRLARAMARCGDLAVELGETGAAREWYARAARVAGEGADDPVAGAVVVRVKDRVAVLAAVEAGLKDPHRVSDFPAEVRAEALALVSALEISKKRLVSAGAAAELLAKGAKTPQEHFLAARAFARCASAADAEDKPGPDYSGDAVEHLELAVAGGFREPGRLSEVEWEAVGRKSPRFAKVVERLRGAAAGED